MLVAFSLLAVACKNTQVSGMLIVRATAAIATDPIAESVEYACGQ